ncbi:unnamed protein product [Rotaria sp. Silwood2]|nr:unnamed protein product [Rotaria sp. Silwood2]CAF3232962.1 unnamed protein product [Rotaria sp. Silwood2]CAF4172775.1 unnamed protein product [Rotaria sp. Silwood2]CAF4265786.1 unnamed protein product [Rotaria sp. Silwood2]CAF4327283.1 unnamed protein product [Rotaria sp. Silwood2]
MNRFTELNLDKKNLPPVAGYWAYPLVSLEQALVPLLSQIHQLERSIEEAKRHCHHPSEHDLTLDESASIFLYTMEAGDYSLYRLLNKALRDEDRHKIKPWFSFLKLFDTALSKLPTVKGNVWRGISSDVSNYYTENELLTWWSVSSCSLSLNVVQGFLSSNKKSTLFMIEAVNGKNLAGYTVYPNEKEVVLKLGSKFRAKSNALHYSDLQIVQLEEVENDGIREYL